MSVLSLSVLQSVSLSKRQEQHGFHWTDFDESWCFRIFRKFVEKIKVGLKSDKNKGYFACTCLCIYVTVWLNYS